jgi:hypothetical protein
MLYRLSKAFDNIYNLLMPILQETGINEKDIRIIHELKPNNKVQI